MANDILKFSNKQFDASLNPLIKGLSDVLGLSTKASFAFLAAYGLRFPDSIDKRCLRQFEGGGSEFRDDTDAEMDTAVDILIERWGDINGQTYIDIRTNQDLLEQCMKALIVTADSVGATWLQNDFIEFKNGVNENNRGDFVALTKMKIDQLAEKTEPF